MKLDILAVGVHPDDVELSASGTLLRQIEAGYRVGLLDLTRGELGTRGSASLRTREALAAAQKMGALVRIQLDMADGFFAQNEANLRKIVHVIRKYQPTIILANALDDRHPDHARAAKLTADAAFLAGLVKIETHENDDLAAVHYQISTDKTEILPLSDAKQLPFRPQKLYHYVQDRNLKADFVVDITNFIDKKLELVLTYASQFHAPDQNSTEPQTPISSPEFLIALRGKDAVNGRLIGAAYGEAFNTAVPIAIKNLFDTL